MLKTKDRKSHNATKQRLFTIFIHGLSIALWAYLLVSIFILNLDNYLVSTFPDLEKYIRYKFIFIILLIALLWRLLGTKDFLVSALFITLYPIVIIGKVIFRIMGFSPNSFLAVLGYTIWTIRSAQKWFLRSAFYLCFLVILYADFGKVATIISMLGLFVLLLFHYFERIYSAFRPESVLSSINNFIKTKWKESREGVFLKDLEDSEKYPPGSPVYNAKKFEKIILIFLFNICFRFVAGKLRTFQESRLIAISSIFKILISLTLTVIVYGFEYFSLNQVLPGSFKVPDASGIFFYIYASFNTILTMAIPDFTPVGSFAKIMTSSELIFSIFLLVILFFVFTTIARERSQAELEELIILVDDENENISCILVSHFNTTVDKLQKLEGIEGDEHKRQIEALIKFKTDVLKIPD